MQFKMVENQRTGEIKLFNMYTNQEEIDEVCIGDDWSAPVEMEDIYMKEI